MFCNKCGNEISENSIFCNKCGEKVKNQFNEVDLNQKENIVKHNKDKTGKKILKIIISVFSATIALILLVALFNINELRFMYALNFRGNDAVEIYNEFVDKGKKEKAEKIVIKYIESLNRKGELPCMSRTDNLFHYDESTNTCTSELTEWDSKYIAQIAETFCGYDEAYHILISAENVEGREGEPLSEYMYPYAESFVNSEYADGLGNITVLQIESSSRIGGSFFGDSKVLSLKYDEKLTKIKDTINRYLEDNDIESQITDVAYLDASESIRFAVCDGKQWYYLYSEMQN